MKETENNTSSESQPNTQTDAMDYFGYDSESVAKQVEDVVPEETVEDLQKKVNEVLQTIKVDDNGKFIYPDDIDPALKLAVAKEKAFRDTQASFTKTRQELKTKEAELEALRQKIAQYETPLDQLSDEERKTLEELKYINPDEWFKRMKALEAKAQEAVNQKLNEVQKEAKQKTQQQLFDEALNNFNKNREVPITKEILESDIPPKWLKQLHSGEVALDEFLEKVASFIDAPKVVSSGNTPPQQTDITKVAGGTQDVPGEPKIDYSQVVF